MRTVTALFDAYDHAAAAVRSLRDAGVASADISLVANRMAEEAARDGGAEARAAAAAGAGALAGGGAGLIAGLGSVAIPGIGPVIAGGWLLASAVGAVAGAAVGGAAGGLLGALANAGVPEEEAHVYAEGVRRGGTLVSVRAADERAETVAAILGSAQGVDIDARRTDYLAEGWTGFDEDAPAYTEEQIRDYRSACGLVPPIA
ncbi:MAG TPA: hypothetical protein VHA07_07700 [Devosia sp.]|nr:hypothetical protein [Devosia sp.]